MILFLILFFFFFFISRLLFSTLTFFPGMVLARDSPAFSNVSCLQDELIVVSERLLSLILVLCIVSWLLRRRKVIEWLCFDDDSFSSVYSTYACHCTILYVMMRDVMIVIVFGCFLWLAFGMVTYEMVNMHLVYMWWETDCSTGCFLNDV